MNNPWPQAIAHVDGDAFFASVYQAIHPHTKGAPLVIGKERGIVTAFSYEAKRLGVTRGMLVSEVKKICPECFVVTSDYRLYELFSKKMIAIAKSFSPYVERYSIDEVFIDLTGLDKVFNTSYEELGKHIKEIIEKSLGLTVSIGVSTTKSLAKIGSNYNKPSGVVTMNNYQTEHFLKNTDVGKIWGIGRATAEKLQSHGLFTAWDFVSESENIINAYFHKPVQEIWHELHGRRIFTLNTSKKTTYQSITKSHTQTPPTTDASILLTRLLSHIEHAFVKARLMHYYVGRIRIYLKTQKFTYHSIEIKLSEKTAYPFLIRDQIRDAFKKIYREYTPYRATGCTLTHLEKVTQLQQSLFYNTHGIEKKLKNIYSLFEGKRIDFGSSLFDKKRVDNKIRFKIPELA